MWGDKGASACRWDKSMIKRNLGFAAVQQTNLLRLNVAGFAPEDAKNRAATLAAAAALALAGSRLLQLDIREIGYGVVKDGPNHTIVLWDNNPGGSGMLLDLCDIGDAWFAETQRLLFVDERHNETCSFGCIRCLLSYSTQRDILAGRLDRAGAISLIGRATS